MKEYCWIVILLLLISCSSPKELIFENKAFEIYRPPGTIEVVENFYADEGEITNIDYREYIFWTKQVYGVESAEYKATLLDTLVWFEQNNVAHLSGNYHNHPMYSNYPVVGISFDQANNYTAWRTERVTEMILNLKKYIDTSNTLTKENIFTIQRYLEGGYDWIKVRKDIVVAKYRLPSPKEWESLAKGNSTHPFGVDSSSKYNRKVLKSWKHLFNTNEYFSSKTNKYKSDSSSKEQFLNVTSPRNSFSKNVNGLFGIIGNVAEMTSEKGIAKGGSWKSSLKEIKIENPESYNQPNCWTGFRNVCQWELMKIK